MGEHDAERRSAPSRPLCSEPWQSYYILRRGILPCCHGHEPIAPMAEWKTAWNSPVMQEIRRHLAQGEPAPYCLLSLSCPIVQRYMREKRRGSILAAFSPRLRPPLLRALNRALGGVPARIYRALAAKQR